MPGTSTPQRGLTQALALMLRSALKSALLLLCSHAAMAAEPCEVLDRMPPGEITESCSGYPCPPWYPVSAARQGRGGRVVLLVTVGANGKSTSASISATSGQADLDQSAIRSVNRLVFPLHYPPGSATAKCYRAPMPLSFEPPGEG